MSLLSWPCYGKCGVILTDCNINRKYCAECSHKRRLASHMKRNHKRAGEREFNRIKINLVKSWITFCEVKRN